MREHSFRRDNEELKDLLQQYENLRLGNSHSFIDEESFEKIIDHFDDQDELGKALEAAEYAVEQFPYSAMLLIKKADLVLASRRYNEALELLDKAELFDSKDINLYILRTDAYLALDQPEKAASILEEAIQIFEGEDRIDLLFELSDVYDDYEEFEKVFDCLKLILEEEPTNEEALYKICFWTDFTGRNEESIRLHQAIIEEHPYNELAWFNLAAAYQGLKLYEKAIDAYQFAVTIDEKMDFAYRNMADAYIRLKKYRDAIEMLEKVVELARPEDVIHEAIGYCYEKLKNYAQARFHYRKASHLNPEDSKLYYKIACTYINEEQWHSAVKQLATAMKIHHNQPDYNLAMGECHLRLGNFKEAIQYYGVVVRLKPRNKTGWEALIRCLIFAGFFEEADEQVSAALIRTDGKPLFLYYKTAILFSTGKVKEGLLVLEKALESSPKQLNKLVELLPSVLQHQQVIDLVARYKKQKSI
jgi:tetratricopeptide (TPR) repeat protein